jgi:phosphoglycolate phosphatase
MDLLLFDVDGTLIDSRNIIIGAQRLTADALGLQHPGDAKGFAVVGLSLDRALIELFGDDVPADHMCEVYKGIFQSLRGQAGYEEPPFDGIDTLLTRASQRASTRLGVATGKTFRGLNHILDVNGWRPLFATIQTADNAPSKPDPGMIRQAIAEAGARPARTLMIGDSVHDVAMAVAAGVTPIAVSWGFQPASLLVEAGARLVAHSVAELDALIETALAVRR